MTSLFVLKNEALQTVDVLIFFLSHVLQHFYHLVTTVAHKPNQLVRKYVHIHHAMPPLSLRQPYLFAFQTPSDQVLDLSNHYQ